MNVGTYVPAGIDMVLTNTITNTAKRLESLELILTRYDAVGRRDTWYALTAFSSLEELDAFVLSSVTTRKVKRVRAEKARRQESDDWAAAVRASIDAAIGVL